MHIDIDRYGMRYNSSHLEAHSVPAQAGKWLLAKLKVSLVNPQGSAVHTGTREQYMHYVSLQVTKSGMHIDI